MLVASITVLSKQLIGLHRPPPVQSLSPVQGVPSLHTGWLVLPQQYGPGVGVGARHVPPPLSSQELGGQHWLWLKLQPELPTGKHVGVMLGVLVGVSVGVAVGVCVGVSGASTNSQFVLFPPSTLCDPA